MKKILISLLLLFIVACIYSQPALKTINSKRDSLYLKYREHKDTVTVRTWVNVVRLNNYLQQIVELDSVLLENFQQKDRLSQQNTDALNGKLEMLRGENKRLEFEKNTLEQQSFIYKRYFLFAITLAVFFFILFLVILIRSKKHKVTIRKLEGKVKDYYTQLHDTKQQIERFEKTEVHLASEINRIKTTLGEELKHAREAQVKAEDEKLMLENQISAVKKAYEREVEKRKETELELEKIKEKLKRTEDHAGILDNIAKLRKSKIVNDLKKKINQLEEKLQEMQQKLKGEMESRRTIEEELSALLDKLKNRI